MFPNFPSSQPISRLLNCVYYPWIPATNAHARDPVIIPNKTFSL